jgi:predicted Abi (CAAX) family protease
MGAAIGAIAAAGAARLDADLLERFRVADATAAARAQPLSTLGVEGSMVFGRYQTAGVIRQTTPSSGRYYLDEVALAAYRRRKNPAAMIAGVGILILAGIALAAATFMTQKSHP